jgi:hypothetical protein
MSSNGETITTLSLEGEGEISLLDILDHVLNSGAVIHGSIVISLAGVDLVYVGLNVIVTSVETALRNIHREQERPSLSLTSAAKADPPPTSKLHR